ncbi:STAS domain-containing protein, partial [bacterium]|nr:STAS domain-containing protein [bacterium]
MHEFSTNTLEDSNNQSDHRSLPKKPIYIIKVGGYLDAITAEALDQAILAVTKSGQFNIIIDLTDAEYIASMGWSIFLNHIKKLRDNQGDLKLANMNDGVFEVYKVLEFFWFLNAYQTVEEAIT